MSSKGHINQLFSRDFLQFSSRGEGFSARVFSRMRCAARSNVRLSAYSEGQSQTSWHMTSPIRMVPKKIPVSQIPRSNARFTKQLTACSSIVPQY